MATCGLLLQVKLADRSLLPGDVIKFSDVSRGTQKGFISNVEVVASVKVLLANQIFHNVDCKDLSPLQVRCGCLLTKHKTIQVMSNVDSVVAEMPTTGDFSCAVTLPPPPPPQKKSPVYLHLAKALFSLDSENLQLHYLLWLASLFCCSFFCPLNQPCKTLQMVQIAPKSQPLPTKSTHVI